MTMKRRNWIAGLLALFFSALFLTACAPGEGPKSAEICVKFMRKLPDGGLVPIDGEASNEDTP
jgi:hypothetical protein